MLLCKLTLISLILHLKKPHETWNSVLFDGAKGCETATKEINKHVLLLKQEMFW